MNDRTKAKLVSGGHKGTEATFGRLAEEWGIPETTISFEGHKMAHKGEVEVLSDEELEKGTVSMSLVFERLGRRFARGKGIRRVIQSMFHIVRRSDTLFAVGWIQKDDTVKGGTGWGVELAKFFNREVHVYDQSKNGWFSWTGDHWEEGTPTIPEAAFSATGTRNLTDEGTAAIRDLFESSFGAA